MVKNWKISERRDLPESQVIALYQSVGWSCAQRPEQLLAGLANSHQLLSAWNGEQLIGLGNSISDGHLVVYFPHLLVHSDYQNQMLGQELFARLREPYADFHQQVLVADPDAVAFYRKCGFVTADGCRAMWVYPDREKYAQGESEIRVEMPTPPD